MSISPAFMQFVLMFTTQNLVCQWKFSKVPISVSGPDTELVLSVGVNFSSTRGLSCFQIRKQNDDKQPPKVAPTNWHTFPNT